MLLDYDAYTRSDSYLMNKIWPIANDFITYYETRYPHNKDRTLKIYPASSLESFSYGTNPTPTVVGLYFALPRLEKLFFLVKVEAFEPMCRNLVKILQPVSVRPGMGEKVISVEEKCGRHINVNQRDLYAVYPFRLYTVGTSHLKTGQYSFEHPNFSDSTQHSYGSMSFIKMTGTNEIRSIFSWNQTGVQAAYLGLKAYTKEILVRSAMANDERYRFPSFYGPNYDYTSDDDHLSVINMTMQSMILQCKGKEICILPAWPTDWNAKFKLYAVSNTTVEGIFENGEMVNQ
jgi:hypothetical protein